MNITELTERLYAAAEVTAHTAEAQPEQRDLFTRAAELIRAVVPACATAQSAAAARQRVADYAEQLLQHYANADELAARVMLRTLEL